MLVSGMMIGTAFTLFVVPSIHMLGAQERRKNDEAVEPQPTGEALPERA